MSCRIVREAEPSFQHKLHLRTDCHETANFGQRLPPTSFAICSKVQTYSALSSSVVSIRINSIRIKSLLSPSSFSSSILVPSSDIVSLKPCSSSWPQYERVLGLCKKIAHKLFRFETEMSDRENVLFHQEQAKLCCLLPTLRITSINRIFTIRDKLLVLQIFKFCDNIIMASILMMINSRRYGSMLRRKMMMAGW